MVWKKTKVGKETVWINKAADRKLTVAKGDKMWVGFLETAKGDWVSHLPGTVKSTRIESERSAENWMKTHQKG